MPTAKPPTRPKSCPLDVRTGSEGGTSMRVSFPGILRDVRRDGAIVSGRIETWRLVGVVAAGGEETRFWVLAPGDKENVIELDGFYVSGRFKILSKTKHARDVQRAFKEFVAL